MLYFGWYLDKIGRFFHKTSGQAAGDNAIKLQQI
jgi:hypothetical protein